MTTTAVEQLLFLLDAAFEGEDWHSLLTNLRGLSPDEWSWLPPRGSRSVRDIVQHVGNCKIMYEHYAFGDGTLDWDDLEVAGGEALAAPDSAITWLRDAHLRLRRSIAGLRDADLAQPRLTNWGELRETRWIVAIMIQHDLYHAGEINHQRSLFRGDDRWEHEREP